MNNVLPVSVGREGTARRRSATQISIMVVDDSLMVRTALTRTIEGQEDMRVAAVANSAEQAIAALQTQRVDVILLDLEMPGIGGLEALPKILQLGRGAQVLIVSSLTERGATETLKALSLGAADTMRKPVSGEFDRDYRAQLADRIRALVRARWMKESARPPAASPTTLADRRGVPASVLAIAGSTGGIPALTTLLSALPPKRGMPILVTQHLPGGFMNAFARQLEVASGRSAVIVSPGMDIERDRIHIAPATGHIVVRRSNGLVVADINNSPMPSRCQPSADPMFASVARTYGSGAIGVVLSGMGTDGSLGARRLVTAGGVILAQDMDTSAVWGMPRAVSEAGLADAVLPPDEIAREITERWPA